MQEPISFNDPFASMRREHNDDENLPEASTTDPSRILDSEEYEVYKNVPVFVEHTRTLKSGRELRFGRDELEALAERSNRRIDETGDFAPVVIGHTNPDPAAPDPPKIGWAGPFRLGWLTKDHTKYAVLADFRIEKDKTPLLNKYPRRSAELWAEDRYEDMYLDPISLLGADTPWSDMGVLYCKQGDEALEKIYYSIAPQAPGAYGTGLPKPVAIKPEPHKREKEKYAMENDDYGRDPKNLSQDQKDVANTIINAIFDSPEFKFLRKMMNKEADEIAEENEQNAKEDRNQSGSAPNEDESGEISEKIEENPISDGNTQDESSEYTGEKEDENNGASDDESNDDSGDDSGDEDNSDSDGLGDEKEESDEESDDNDFDSYLEQTGLNRWKDTTNRKDEPDSDVEEKEEVSDEEKGDDDDDSDFDSYLEKNGLGGYKGWFKKQRERSRAAESEKSEDSEKEEGAADADDSEEDENDDDVNSMSDEEFEAYLRKKYNVQDDDDSESDEEDDEDEEEDSDDEDEDEEDDDEESDHARYFKEEDDLESDAGGNPFLSKTIEELETYLESKYGDEQPQPGTPLFNKLSTDLAYLALLIKTNEEQGYGDGYEDDDEDPYGVNENWNRNHGDAANAGVDRSVDDMRNHEAGIRQEFAKMSPEERRQSDSYYRWKYSRQTSPYALFDKGDDMTPKEYYQRRGRGDDQVEIQSKYPTDDDFDPRELLNANAAEEKTRDALDSASDDQKPALREKLDKIQQYQKSLRSKKQARDKRFAEQYAKNAAGIAVNILSPDYDGDLIFTLEATIGELEQLKERLENNQWLDAAKSKVGRALTREEEDTAWSDHLNDLAKQGVWWAINPKLDYDPNEGDEYDVYDDEPAVSYEGEEDDSVAYQADKDDEEESSDEESDAKDDEEEEPTEYAKKKKTTSPGKLEVAGFDVDDDGDDEEIEIEPDDSLVDPDDELEDDVDPDSELEDDGDGVEVEQNCRGASEQSVQYCEGADCGDGRSREELLSEIETLKNRIAGLENAFNLTTEKVVSAERYSRLHDLRERFLFDENAERENCRYSKMSDEQFEKRCEEIQTNYRRVPTGIEVPPGLVTSAPADAERPGAVQYSKEASADFERQVRERAETYAAQGIYKPSDEIRAEIAAESKQS